MPRLIKRIAHVHAEYWATISLVLGIIVIAGGFFYLGHKANKNAENIATLQLSIEKSCILLNNKITESGSQAGDPSSPTALLITEIVEGMTPEERKNYDAAVANQPKVGLTLIPCHTVAQHPDTIVQTDQKQKP